MLASRKAECYLTTSRVASSGPDSRGHACLERCAYPKTLKPPNPKGLNVDTKKSYTLPKNPKS